MRADIMLIAALVEQSSNRLRIRLKVCESLIIGAWRSLVAHLVWDQGVGGSNPLAPTILLVLSDE